MEKITEKYTQLTNNQIVTIYINNNLIKECVDNQFFKFNKKYKEDYYQDLIVTLLLYDNNKLNNAHQNNHFNALITRIIQNNINSNTSEYYRKYIKYDEGKTEITKEIKENYTDENI